MPIKDFTYFLVSIGILPNQSYIIPKILQQKPSRSPYILKQYIRNLDQNQLLLTCQNILYSWETTFAPPSNKTASSNTLTEQVKSVSDHPTSVFKRLFYDDPNHKIFKGYEGMSVQQSKCTFHPKIDNLSKKLSQNKSYQKLLSQQYQTIDDKSKILKNSFKYHNSTDKSIPITLKEKAKRMVENNQNPRSTCQNWICNNKKVKGDLDPNKIYQLKQRINHIIQNK